MNRAQNTTSHMINRLCTSRVHKGSQHVGNQQLSPATPRDHSLVVDGCVQVCAGHFVSHAGRTRLHPQSTALIIRTISNPHQDVMTTMKEISREISV
jgi:uncharacterized metal-binding protein